MRCLLIKDFIVQLVIAIIVAIVMKAMNKLSFDYIKNNIYKFLYILSIVLLLLTSSFSILLVVKKLIKPTLNIVYFAGLFTFTLNLFNFSVLSNNLNKYLFNNFNNK